MPTASPRAISRALSLSSVALIAPIALTPLIGGATPAGAAGVLRTATSLTPGEQVRPANQDSVVMARVVSLAHGVAGHQVELWQQRSTTVWVKVANKPTDAHGYAAFHVRLTKAATYIAKFAGDGAHGASRSQHGVVTIRSAPTRAAAILAEAARHAGAPYLYGATGPTRFDCSGFTRYVFGRLGTALPHNSAAQYAYTKHLTPAQKQPGDLIFYYDGGGINHVGIYAGGNQIWASTHTGDVVRREDIYTTHYLVGRA